MCLFLDCKRYSLWILVYLLQVAFNLQSLILMCLPLMQTTARRGDQFSSSHPHIWVPHTYIPRVSSIVLPRQGARPSLLISIEGIQRRGVSSPALMPSGMVHLWPPHCRVSSSVLLKYFILASINSNSLRFKNNLEL